MRLAKWLEELRGLPPDAPEWAGMGEFVDALEQLIRERQSLLTRSLTEIDQALTRLREENREELDYFGFVACEGWSLKGLLAPDPGTVLTQLIQFSSALGTYAQVRRRVSTSLAEEQDRRGELSQLEVRVYELHRTLSTAFTQAGPTEPNASQLPVGGRIAPPEEDPVPPTTAVGPVPPPVELSLPETINLVVTTDVRPAVPGPVSGDVRELAALLRDGSDPEAGNALVWALVREDDLPAAYWLARTLGRPAMPDWVIAAVQGARWLSSDSEALVGDLLGIAANHLDGDEPIQLLGLAAAVKAAVVAPATGLAAWLKSPTSLPALHDVVSALGRYASLGRSLRADDLLGVAGASRREQWLTQASQETTRWLAEAPFRRTKLKRATDVLRALVRQGGDLDLLLRPVAEDRRADVARVREKTERLRDRDHVVRRVREIDQGFVRTKVREITGDPRDQILRTIDEACELADRWCSVIERENQMRTRGAWISEQISRLRDALETALPTARRELLEVAEGPSLPFASAARCLLRALDELSAAVDLPADQGTNEAANGVLRFLSEPRTLQLALNRRLLWLYELALDDDASPTDADTARIPETLSMALAEGRTLRAALEGWLAKHDYRFAQSMLLGLEGDEGFADLHRVYLQALEGSRTALNADVSRTLEVVEQSVVDGIIAEEKRADYIAVIAGVKPEQTLNFPVQHSQLQQVRAELTDARRVRLAELREDWQRILARLKTSEVGAQKRTRVQEFVEAALEREDTRVMEECLARLAEALDLGLEVQDRWFSPTVNTETLSDYIRLAPQIAAWIEEEQGLQAVVNPIRHGRMRAGLDFDRLPKPRRDEAVAALEAWRRLKQRTAASRESPRTMARNVEAVLRFVGFNFDTLEPTQVDVERWGADWVHVRASMSAAGLAQVPQFGSQQHGPYDVVCVWERPSVDTMTAWIRDLRLDTRSVIVLYFGRMSIAQRRVFLRESRDREMAIVVLDETMMVFLAAERDARLRAFFRCTVPFTALNPYTPFRAGNVPPEMFYGRTAMARELERAEGSCLVYGGRQLGKSALLRYVQWDFHQPGLQQFAWVDDIKLLGDVEAGFPKEIIWRRLRDEFKRAGLVSTRASMERPEEIVKMIRESVLSTSDRRVLVLFDEADHFLDADARDHFRVVEALRTLMLDTQRRFKVVFAGLHNVQRFQGIPNQPLAHFGRPVLVGPLEPDAAQMLVREPLNVLGYRFTSDATVLSILSYTNYHPGLIQLFCHELVRRLHSRVNGTPPTPIDQSDVEAVYRLQDVRSSIRERFDWTLALDMRYQAIAWTMILDQLGARDSYARAYSPGEVLGMVRDWWSRGFSETSEDQVRGLLDEMSGLGVLVRGAEGHYRLRSPNLVRLMGTETDIENKLLQFAEKQPPVVFDADSHHASLDEARKRYSPLTYAQERLLSAPRFGVGLVFASDALGYSYLAPAVQRFLSRDTVGSARAECTEIPDEELDALRLGTWLEAYLRTTEGRERMLVVGAIRSSGAALEEVIETGIDFCRRHERTRQRWLRLLLFFDANASWKWLLLPQKRRRALEDRADVVLSPRRWNVIGLRQRLAHYTEFHSDENCQEILNATGGWPFLLDRFFDRLTGPGRSRYPDDPRPMARDLASDIGSPHSELRAEFRVALLHQELALPQRVLAMIQKEGDVPRDLLTPEIVGGSPELSQEDCDVSVEYLLRMGLLEPHGDTVRAEPISARVLAEL